MPFHSFWGCFEVKNIEFKEEEKNPPSPKFQYVRRGGGGGGGGGLKELLQTLSIASLCFFLDGFPLTKLDNLWQCRGDVKEGSKGEQRSRQASYWEAPKPPH